MRAIILALPFILTLTSGSSQPVFKKMYGGFSIFNFELKSIPRTNLFLFSNHNNINTDHTFFKIDENGEPFNQNYIYQPIGGSTSGAHRYYFRSDSVYDLVGKHFTPGTYPSVIFISRRDSSLQNVIDNRFYETRSSTPPGIVSCINDDSTYTLAGGYAVSPGQYFPMIFKLDSGLNVSWSRSYRDRVGYVQEILPAPNGGWYLLMHLVNEGMSLAKTDSVGTILWCKNYQQPFRYVNGMIRLQDDNILLTGYKNPTGTGFVPVEIFLTKVDSTGQVIWSKTYGDSFNAFYKAGQNPTFFTDTAIANRIILTGIFKRQWQGYTDIVGALLGDSGDIIWSRCYGNEFFDEFGSICRQVSDGGFIIGGYNNYQANVFPPVTNMANVTIIKTDSLGVSDGCMEYPVIIYYEPDTPLGTNLTWSIYVDSIVTEVPSNMVDTTGTPTRNEDMCTFVSLMELSDPQFDIEIFPNPNSGVFRIRLSDRELYLTIRIDVLDLSGRSIFSIETNSENENIVSVPKLVSGMYLVKITVDNFAMTKKMIVE